MMFKKVVFLCLIALSSMSVFAQGEIILKAEKMSDFYPQSLWKSSGKGYLFKVGDGDFQVVGYKGSNLEEVLKNDEAAYKELKKFKRKVNVSKAAYYIGLAGLVAFPMSINENDNDEQVRNKILATAGVSLVGSVTSLVLTLNSPKHLYNAVEIYNRNLNK